MLWNSSGLVGYAIEATDGAIGGVEDFLFDDRSWAIRWIVVDTGAWLPGRRVLLPPPHLGEPDAARRVFPIDLSRERVKDSPDLDADAPVSRRHEAALYGHYGWAPYWAGGYAALGGLAAPIAQPPLYTAGNKPVHVVDDEGDPHLRAAGEVTGYSVRAADGDIGHVDDLLVDSEDWAIRYAVIDTKNWWPGKKVLVAPQWLTGLDWAAGTVRANLTREAIRSAPEYDPDAAADRAYEERLWRHYGTAGYWA